MIVMKKSLWPASNQDSDWRQESETLPIDEVLEEDVLAMPVAVSLKPVTGKSSRGRKASGASGTARGNDHTNFFHGTGLLNAECLWNERIRDGRTWADMPGSDELIQKMNFAVFRRLPLVDRHRWMIQAGREARESNRDAKSDKESVDMAA